jgi:hypothetical protein
LRLSGRIVKASEEEARLLKEFADHEVAQFRKRDLHLFDPVEESEGFPLF